VFHQKTGNDDELHPAVQIVVGNSLKPVTLDQISCQCTVVFCLGGRGGSL
jgi:hypothetical protein